MPVLHRKTGTSHTSWILKKPLPGIAAFDATIRSFIEKNPLACVPCRYRRRDHPPIERVREMYTAKFCYTAPDGRRVGSSSEVYDSVEGYMTGVAAVISNLANIASHRGKLKRLPSGDRFNVILMCHDPGGDHYFLSIARDRITLSSYGDPAIRERVEAWMGSLPDLTPAGSGKG